MGIYLNPGNEAFQISVNDDIYVDKSELISFTNNRVGKRKRFICVSRPRRFGKSMAAEMLSAYYDKSCDSGKLFQNLDISKDMTFDKHLNQYNVIFLNIQQFLRKAGSALNLTHYMEDKVLDELKKEYAGIISNTESSLPDALTQIYKWDMLPERGFVFIIDEWDCIFREAKNNVEAQRQYLDFLRDLFKDRVYVKLAYMTGILPIKKYGTHSALNIFDEFSMTAPGRLAKYVGFTESEVRDLCEKHNMSFTDAQNIRAVKNGNHKELPTGNGYADIVFLPYKYSDKPAMIVELKWDKDAEGAITQIKKNNYIEAIKNYGGDILLVGINYDKNTKKHTCIIEKCVTIQQN